MGKKASSCRACGGSGDIAPCVAEPVCLGCWRRVPAKLRIAAVGAHRRRRHEPARYADTTAGVLQWCLDQATALREVTQ